MEQDYYKYISGWKAECDNLSQQVRQEVGALPDEWFAEVDKDNYDDAAYKQAVMISKRGEIVARLDKLLPPYVYFRERMLKQDKEDGVGFEDGRGQPLPSTLEKPIKQGNRGDVWVEVGKAEPQNNNEGLMIKYTDGRGSAFVSYEILNQKHYGYTCVLKGIRTNLFANNDGSFTVNELQNGN